MTEHKHIFIGGLHRSGTTLLASILQEHPEISGFKNTGVNQDEGQFLQSVFPIAQKHGGAGLFGFNPSSSQNENSKFADKKNAPIIFSEWKKHWDLNRPYLLEKSPPNILKTRLLQHLFPNSFFIIITRSPIAVSFATSKWRRWIPFFILIWHWVVCHEKFENDRPFIKNLMVIKYEELVAQPDKTLQNVFSFLKLNKMGTPLSVDPSTNDKYFFKWKNMDNHLFGTMHKKAALFFFEKRTKRFGYSLK